MPRLPIDRVVDVNLTRRDNFATRRGFGVPLLVHAEAAGPLDANTRTKVYGSMDEVAVDYAPATEAYKMAQAAFSQEVQPVQIKLGWRDPAKVTGPDFTAELDAIWDYDPDWYWLHFDSGIRGVDVMEDAAMAWGQTRRIQIGFEGNEVEIQSPADATNLGARAKGESYDRSWGFYHTDAALYPAVALSSRLATFNFDDPDSAYTAKFKRLVGIAPVNIGSAGVQGATGFVPQLGLQSAQGHLWNTYVDIGGVEMVVEGQNFGEAFIDEVHAGDWIVSRTEERLLDLLANNNRIPYTNRGVGMLVHCVEEILNRAFIAGLVADFENEFGEILPAFEIKVQRVEDVAQSQRRQRIAPTIQAFFRYAGAIHYTRVDYTMTF
ncbi:MAG: DUF3383 family protein [Nitratireductor sp.]|nr:DUF3383 family protein [Nitratireductor sp.]